MVLRETDMARVPPRVDARNDRLPERTRGQLRYELDVVDRHLPLYECRPPWRPECGPDWMGFPIVRFHYAKARHDWATYWRDRNVRFHRSDLLAPSRRIEDRLAAVDADSTGIFWG